MVIHTSDWARVVWVSQVLVSSCTCRVSRYVGLCGLQVELHWTGSGQLAAWICYSFPALGLGRPWCYIAMGLFGCKTREGGGQRLCCWSVLSAGVSPRPRPRRWTMPAHCACPIDSGCSGTLPWVPSMGSLGAGGISLMGRQELLWLQTLGQRPQNKRYNGSRLATCTGKRVWGERREKVVRRAMKKEETKWRMKGSAVKDLKQQE